MWRRAFALLLIFMLIGSVSAAGVEPRWSVQDPQLEFDGTTAYCAFSCSSMGDKIAVTMNLWNGDTLIKSWTQAGESVVTMNKTCTVSRGKTYVLEVSGTYGSTLFGPVSVSKRCPLFG